jgi:hypothetical protein
VGVLSLKVDPKPCDSLGEIVVSFFMLLLTVHPDCSYCVLITLRFHPRVIDMLGFPKDNLRYTSIKLDKFARILVYILPHY